jgi:hypothetical protein
VQLRARPRKKAIALLAALFMLGLLLCALLARRLFPPHIQPPPVALAPPKPSGSRSSVQRTDNSQRSTKSKSLTRRYAHPGRRRLTEVQVQNRLTYHLLYRDSQLTDADRATLIQFVANVVSEDRWPINEFLSNESLPDLVRRIYNLSSTNEPNSTAVILALVQRANPNRFGPTPFSFKAALTTSPVKLPPIPRHLQATTTTEAIRVQPLGTSELREASSTVQLEDTPASALPPQGDSPPGDTTVIMLGTYEEISAEAKRQGYLAQLPSSAKVFRNDGYVDLLARGTDEPIPKVDCHEAKEWLTNLLKDANISDLRRQLGGDAISEKVSDRASRDHLVVLDWVAAPLNHGRKVESVVRYVLETLLKSPELSRKPYFDVVDLNPAHPENRPALLDAVQEYKNWYCDVTGSCLEDGSLPPYARFRFTEARKWIMSGGSTNPLQSHTNVLIVKRLHNDVDETRRFPVDQMVLEAVLWEHLLRPSSKTWLLNMSFTVEFAIGLARRLPSSRSLIVTAASNEHKPELYTEFPQGFSLSNQKVVTVTYANRDGSVLGGYTFQGPETIVPVSVIAPGCGYAYKAIAEGEYGTSFATPFVAALAWVEHLINGTDAIEERALLVQASVMRPKVVAVESAGMFEPRMLTHVGHSWFAEYPSASSGRLSGAISIRYLDAAGQDQILTVSDEVKCSLAIYGDGGPSRFLRQRACVPFLPSTYKILDVTACTLKDGQNQPLSICNNPPNAPNGLLQLVFSGHPK